MLVMIFTMLIVLVLAAAVIAVVVMGMEGTGRDQHPEIADAMARTARHLNGEGEPPRALVAVVGEMDEVGDINVRDLPAKLRAASAASARSARTAWSALSARSATSANAPEREPQAEPEPEPEPEAAPAGTPAQSMSEALAAPVPVDRGAEDPYGVWGEASPQAEGDAAPPPPQDGGDVVRVRLPGRDVPA